METAPTRLRQGDRGPAAGQARLREGARTPAGGARAPTGVDRPRGPEGGRAVRGPRHGRQGRHDQAHHREDQPAHGAAPWRSARRPSASARSGTSSATSPTCPPPARSSCSTAAGTTAPASSTSWASARRTSTRSSCAPARSSSAPAALGDHPRQVLAVGQRRGAGAPLRGAPARPAQALEAQPHGPAGPRALGRLRRSEGRHVRPHRHRESPWYVVEADDKRTMRLNLISHLLSLIPYEDVRAREDQASRRARSGPTCARPSATRTTCPRATWSVRRSSTARRPIASRASAFEPHNARASRVGTRQGPRRWFPTAGRGRSPMARPRPLA